MFVQFLHSTNPDLLSNWIDDMGKQLDEEIGKLPAGDGAESIIQALARLSGTTAALSDQLQLALIQSRCPESLQSMSWDIDYVHGDDGTYYLDIEPVVLSFAIDGRNISLYVRCDEFDLEDLDDDELTALTGLPVIDDDSREMVLDYYGEDETRLFGFEPMNVTEVAYSLSQREQRDSHTFRTMDVPSPHSEAA